MSKTKVLILGGSGFVGSNVCKELLKADLDLARIIRVNKESDERFKDYLGDITNLNSLEKALADFKPDVVVHLVGIIKEKKPLATFQNIVVNGTKNLVQASQDNGVKKIIFVSAIGADLNGNTEYFKTKAIAEDYIKNSNLDFIIFRPSLIFGPGAGFTNQFVDLLKIMPFAPIIGSGEYPFQPISIISLAECISQSCTNLNLKNKIYDLVGLETISLKEIVNRLKIDMSIRRFNIHIPLILMKFIGKVGDLGLPVPVTLDQMRMLEKGSVGDAIQIRKDFEFQEVAFKPKGNYPLY